MSDTNACYGAVCEEPGCPLPAEVAVFRRQLCGYHARREPPAPEWPNLEKLCERMAALLDDAQPEPLNDPLRVRWFNDRDTVLAAWRARCGK